MEDSIGQAFQRNVLIYVVSSSYTFLLIPYIISNMVDNDILQSGALVSLVTTLADNHPYRVSVYDCEPAGVVVSLTKDNEKPLTLTLSKAQLASAQLDGKSVANMTILAQSMSLETEDAPGRSQMKVVSTLVPEMKSKVLPTEEGAKVYLQSAVAGVETLPDLLATGLTALCREKPVGLDATEWLGHWLLENNPNRPKVEN